MMTVKEKDWSKLNQKIVLLQCLTVFKSAKISLFYRYLQLRSLLLQFFNITVFFLFFFPYFSVLWVFFLQCSSQCYMY